MDSNGSREIYYILVVSKICKPGVGQVTVSRDYFYCRKTKTIIQAVSDPRYPRLLLIIDDQPSIDFLECAILDPLLVVRVSSDPDFVSCFDQLVAILEKKRELEDSATTIERRLMKEAKKIVRK